MEYLHLQFMIIKRINLSLPEITLGIKPLYYYHDDENLFIRLRD